MKTFRLFLKIEEIGRIMKERLIGCHYYSSNIKSPPKVPYLKSQFDKPERMFKEAGALINDHNSRK